MSEQRKVYSADIKPYSFEGNSGIFGTLLSIIVGPIRLVSRVMHNVFILPANLQLGYAKSLKLVSGILLLVGLAELVVIHRWPLAASQVPVLWYAMRLESKAKRSANVGLEKREVEVDLEEVEELCNSIYSEYKELLEDD